LTQNQKSAARNRILNVRFPPAKQLTRARQRSTGAPLNAADDSGCTPLHYCSHENAVFLLELNDPAAEPRVLPEPLDHAGRSPLHLAVEEDKVFLLVRSGCDINRMDASGNTPLDDAIETGRVEVENAIRSFPRAATSRQLATQQTNRGILRMAIRVAALIAPIALIATATATRRAK
jgi:ankyrin repeat protein